MSDTGLSMVADPTAQHSVEAFTFGDAEAVLDRRELFDLFETTSNGKWFEPPVPPRGLGQAYRMTSHHQSAILLKRNLLLGSFIPSRWLSRQDFSRWALDWLIMGNAYLQNVPNMAGRPMALKPVPAAYCRTGVEAGVYWYVRNSYLVSEAIRFEPGAVHHLLEPDPLQEIYGMPEYLSALQSGLLNEAATIFRRRYYINGSHAGFILHVTDVLSEKDGNALRQALRDAKGVGNFKNMFVHTPQGHKDGIKLIPIAEVAAKDEFLNIKEVTRDDVLAAHRVPPQLLGVVPKNTGGFGNVVDAARTFFGLEIVPIMRRMEEVNDWLGVQAVTFKPLAENEMLAAVMSVTPATNSPAR